MKKIFNLLLTAFAFVALASCESNEVEGPAPVEKLPVLSNQSYFQATGGEGRVVVDAEAAVEASANKSWLTTSVSGNVVTLTAQENKSVESRYATVTIKSGDAVAVVEAQQFGFQTVSFSIDDILVDSRSHTYSYPYTYLSDMTVSTNVDWITASAVKDEAGNQSVSVTVAENLTGEVRQGQVSWKLGMDEGAFTVTQYPVFTVNEAWSLTYVEDEGANSILDAEGPEGPFAIDIMTKSAFESKYDSVFETFAVDVVTAANPSHLFTETGDVKWALLDNGVYVAVMVGVDEDYNPTGEYNYFEIEVERQVVDNRTPYEKWLGKWEVKRSDAYTDTWVISENVKDQSYTITGIESSSLVNNIPGAEFPVVATFNAADGTIDMKVQTDLGNVNVSGTTASMGLYGQIDYQGTIYYITGSYSIFTGALGDDDEATLTPGVVNITSLGGQFTLVSMSYIATADGSGWNFNNQTPTPLPLTIKQIERVDGTGTGGGGDSDGSYSGFLGSWSDGSNPVTIAQKVVGSSYTVTGFGIDVTARYNNGTLELYGQELGSDDTYVYYFWGIDQEDYLEEGAQDGTSLLAKATIKNGSLSIVGHEYVATYGGTDYDEIICQLGIYGENKSDGKYYPFTNMYYMDLPATLTKGSGAPALFVAKPASHATFVTKAQHTSFEVGMPAGVKAKRR